MIYVNECDCGRIFLSNSPNESHYCGECGRIALCRPFNNVEEAVYKLVSEFNIEGIQKALGVKINVEIELDGAHKESVVQWHLMGESTPPEDLDVLVTCEYLGEDIVTIDRVFDIDDGVAYWYNGDETYKAWAYLPKPYDDSDVPYGRLADEV